MGWLAIVALCGLILYGMSQGAPYVPTRKSQAEKALELMNLAKGAVIVDIGAGDGGVLQTAAEEGYKAVGIELNPFLYLIARLRTRRFGKSVKIIRGNVWKWHLPPETEGVFLFTAGPFTAKLNRWLRAEQKRLNKPLTVVSLGFNLPEEKAVARSSGCVKYILR